jgi:IS6 family transposase
VSPGLGFASFQTAWKTLRGYEAMDMIRKGQIEKVGKEDIRGQARSIENLFGVAA